MPVNTAKKGFTLIELMIAISIVAVLATIGMVMYSSTQSTARDAKRKGDLEDIKSALFLYKAANGSFCPHSTATNCTLDTSATDATNGFEAAAGSGIKRLLPYMKAAVHDPKNATATGDYFLNIRYENFVLSATLENAPGTVVACTSGGVTGPYVGVAGTADDRNYCISE